MLEKVFPYKKSNTLLVIISFISIFVFAVLEKRMVFVLLSCILIKSIIEEANLLNIKYNKFLLERYLIDFNFRKGKIINSVENIKRSRKHDIKKDGVIYPEREYLNKYYKWLTYKGVYDKIYLVCWESFSTTALKRF